MRTLGTGGSLRWARGLRRRTRCGTDIVVGANFPDYQLEDQSGVLRRLSELQGGNPMVLHLSRGSYDPKEHRFLRNLVDSYPEFRVAYTRLVVVSTDNPLNLNEFRDSLGAPWPFLGDPERTVQRDLDIEEFTDPHNPMIPSHLRAGAGTPDLPHLQRLLVLGPTDDG